MSQAISLWGATYSNVPSILLPKSGGGQASFVDVTDTTATAADVANDKYIYLANGTRTQGSLAFVTVRTGSSDPSSSLGSDGDIYLKV